MRQEPTHQEEEESTTYPLHHSAAFAGSTLVTMGLVDLVAHLGPTGFLVSALSSYVAWKHGPELYAALREKLPSPSTPSSQSTAQQSPSRGRSLLDRALGRFPDAPLQEDDLLLKEAREDEVAFDLHGAEDVLPRPPLGRGPFLFSSVLDQFHPTLERLFLARMASGLDLCCSARDLCRVALAGNTGGGKSSIMRLLMLQLCSVGVRVLLLNPHYTRYDLETGEDWTPFEPYLVHPPMACRSYQVIEHYLRSTAKELIPKRLERRAHSQPVGQPYFLVLDELPSMVREIAAAPLYLRVILEEGRKVGVFLISAAHDFLVKTISPKAGGGAIRECYRTAYYVGGDPTTARTLLDMPASLVPEDELGQGVAMLRSVPTRKAIQVFVPSVENASVYRLLGPSTYQASRRSPGGAEVEFPSSSPISQSGNGGNGGNAGGNSSTSRCKYHHSGGLSHFRGASGNGKDEHQTSGVGGKTGNDQAYEREKVSRSRDCDASGTGWSQIRPLPPVPGVPGLWADERRLAHDRTRTAIPPSEVGGFEEEFPREQLYYRLLELVHDADE